MTAPVGGERGHRRWRADLAAYLLGSLEPEESRALEDHLEECDRCRDELRWLQPAIDVIPASVPQLEAPPALRARLLAEVRSDAAQLAAAAPAAAARERRAAAVRDARGTGGTLDGLRGLLLRPAAALAVAALIGAGVAGYALRGGGGQIDTTTTAASQGGMLRATLERHGDSGTLQLTGLAELPRSRVYQAWVQRDGRIEPSSLFDARRDGTASTAIPHQLEGAEAVMVSSEPRGGSRQPTSAPLIRVGVPS
jgi:Anti-sigma-K factor rskA/Putative zinc-finger